MKLKIYYTFIFILLTFICNGQAYQFSQQHKTWASEDFISNNISHAKAYSYKVTKGGKIKKDSTLLYSQQYDRSIGKVYGINHSISIGMHSDVSFPLYKFEDIYNAKNQLISSNEYDIPSKEKEVNDYEISYNRTEYIYDKDDNIIKESHMIIHDTYDPFSNDSVLYFKSVYSHKIYEHTYKNNLRIMSFDTSDSTRTRNYKDNITKAECSYCHPKSKFLEKEYYDNGNLKLTTSYTREGKYHTKKYYYYDISNRLNKEIDSTGWYLSSTKPYLESKTEISYTNNGKILTKTDYKSLTTSGGVITEQYDLKDQLLGRCGTFDSQRHCDRHQYFYEDNKIKQVISTLYDDVKVTTFFNYDKTGLMSEEITMHNDKVVEVIRYFYK